MIELDREEYMKAVHSIYRGALYLRTIKHILGLFLKGKWSQFRAFRWLWHNTLCDESDWLVAHQDLIFKVMKKFFK